METPFLQGVTWNRQGVLGTSNSWEDSSWTQEQFFFTTMSHFNSLLMKTVDFLKLDSFKI